MSNNGGCEQMCVNNIGSYFCDCHEGYDVDVDGLNCSGIMHFITFMCILVNHYMYVIIYPFYI